MSNCFPVPKNKTIRSKDFTSFVRSLPCAISDRHRCGGDIVPAHQALGERGVSLKGDDTCCIPLCHTAHAEEHQIGEKSFEQKYSISLWRESRKVTRLFFKKLLEEGKIK